MKKNILIVGATSAMGRAFAALLAKDQNSLILAGRRLDDLERISSDLRIRYGAQTEILGYEALATDPRDFSARCKASIFGELDGVVLCTGEMADETIARSNPSAFLQMVQVNYTSTVSLLEALVDPLQIKEGGFVCAVASVAADRGRASNGLYGSSKGALSLYLQSLRARLARLRIRVVTIKPGFTDTSMTWGLPGLFLVAAPSRVARDALRGIQGNRSVIYTPWFWGGIMLIIRWLPDRVFSRLGL